MEDDIKHRRPVSNLLTWEEAGLYPEIFDYFEATHYKETGNRAWELLHWTNFHAAQQERIRKGKPLYEYGQFKGLWAELHLSALMETVFPYSPQGIVTDARGNVAFPITSQRNRLNVGLQPASVIVSDIRGAFGKFLQNKFEIDILLALEDSYNGTALPFVAQVKNRVPNIEETVHDIGRNTVTYLSKVFDRYPNFLFAYCLPSGRSYSSGVQSVMDNFRASGGVIIKFDHDELFIEEVYEDYILSLGF